MTLPWMVLKNSFVESEHPREEHGRFSETAQKHRDLLNEAKKLRSDAFNQAKSDAMEHHEHANSTAAGLSERMGNIAWDSENEDEQIFTDLESLVMEYDPTGTVSERMSSLKDIVTAAKEAMKTEQSDEISNTDKANNKQQLKDIIAGAKKAQEHLRTHAGHRREMAAIKSGEEWKSIREWIKKGCPESPIMLPWLVLKSGQFTESKHKRGNPKNAGQFSSTGGGGGAKAKPQVGAKPGMGKPSAGIQTPGKGKPPATPYKVQPAGVPPLPQQQAFGGQPHEKTMNAAVQAGNAALQEVTSGNTNGPAKKVFGQALHAHYDEGIKALKQMVQAKYGNSPKGQQAFQQAQQQFVGKIRAAWAKVNQPQGAQPPPLPEQKLEAPSQPYGSVRNATGGPPMVPPKGENPRGTFERVYQNMWGEMPGRGRKEKGPQNKRKHRAMLQEHHQQQQLAKKTKKSIGDSLVTKSSETFDLTVELVDENVPAWLRKRK